MTTANGVTDFKYKVGVQDDVGVHLTQNGEDIDLTGVVVTFVIKDITDADNRIEVSCTNGGTVGDTTYSESEGGCTINFGNTDLATEGEYHCEFVGTLNSVVWFRIPYDNSYYVLMIYPAV